jgi:hypothetical protein
MLCCLFLVDNESRFREWILSPQKISKVPFPEVRGPRLWVENRMFKAVCSLCDPVFCKNSTVTDMSIGFHMIIAVTAQLHLLMVPHLYYKKYILLLKKQTLWSSRYEAILPPKTCQDLWCLISNSLPFDYLSWFSNWLFFCVYLYFFLQKNKIKAACWSWKRAVRDSPEVCAVHSCSW